MFAMFKHHLNLKLLLLIFEPWKAVPGGRHGSPVSSPIHNYLNIQMFIHVSRQVIWAYQSFFMPI